MKVHRIDHVGIIVDDLPAAKAFFLDLGLQATWEGEVDRVAVERVTGLRGAKSEIVMLETPDGDAKVELSRFHAPTDENGIQPSLPNTLGMRHIAFEVEDLEGILGRLTRNGVQLLGELHNYENTYRLCYIRGPEGIIVELAERI